MLDVIEPSVAIAVSGRNDSAAVLERLAREHVFVVELEGEVLRYRFHPLFTDVLRGRLQVRDPRAAAEAHRNASEWYEQHGIVDDAVEHALSGGHYQRTLDLIGLHLAALYDAGRRIDIRRWLTAIPDSFVLEEPVRMVDLCMAGLVVSLAEATGWLARAEVLVGSDRPDLRSRLAFGRAVVAAGAGRVEEFEAEVAHALAEKLRADADDDAFEEVVAAWSVRMHLLAGRTAKAASEAAALARSKRAVEGDTIILGILAVALRANGDPAGHELAGVVMNSWRAAGEPHYVGMADLLTMVGADELAAGHRDAAELLAADAVALSTDGLAYLLRVRAEILLARIERASSRHAEAEDRLRNMRIVLARAGVEGRLVDLLDSAASELTTATPPRQPFIGPTDTELTDREQMILEYLASHLTFPEIGRACYISRHTVKTHVGHIYRKLGVSGRSEAIVNARSAGLLPPT